jgi:hypothetical protein
LAPLGASYDLFVFCLITKVIRQKIAIPTWCVKDALFQLVVFLLDDKIIQQKIAMSFLAPLGASYDLLFF